MNYKQRRLKSVLTAITIILAPFALILANATIVDSPAPFAYAQTWAEPTSAWMNVTGGNGALNWIFREGYYPSPFTVNIGASGVTDLFTWEFKLSWNASLLDVTSVTEGSFLSDGVPGTTAFYSETFQDQAGSDYVFVNCTLMSGSGKSGSGVIATVDFDLDTSATAGSTPLDLYETKLRDSSLKTISHGITDGFVFMGDHNMYPFVYMLPQTAIADAGEMFSVTIWLDNVESLQAWGFELSWTSHLLEATNIVNHVFLTGDSLHFENIDNLNGKAFAVAVLMGEQEGTYGGGPLATITFRVERAGTTALNLIVRDNDLIGIFYDPPYSFTYLIPHAAFGGSFRSTKPAASFTFTPQPLTPMPAVNQTILFNATESSDPGGLDIISYFWEFGDGSTTAESDPIIVHVYKSPGFYMANLTVTNSEGKSSETFRVFTVVIRDIAVTEVRLSHLAVMQNSLVSISVTVENEGIERETFLIQTYLWHQSTSTLLGSDSVTLYTQEAVVTRYFVWDTTGCDLDDYVIQGIVPPLAAESDTGNNAAIAPIILTSFNKIDYPVQSGSQVFHVLVESNSTLSYPSPFMPTSFKFNGTAREISFNVTGSTNALSYCNVTIPRDLLRSQPLNSWIILFDGAAVTDCVITKKTSYTFIYLNYGLSEHKIQIIGRRVPHYFKDPKVGFCLQTALRGTAIDATSLIALLRDPDGITLAVLSIASIGLIGGMLVLWKREKKRYL